MCVRPRNFNQAPKAILPKSCFVSAFSWGVEDKVRAASVGVQVHPDCLEDKLLVVPELRGEVIHWGHTNRVACYPGILKTLSMVQQPLWWPKLKDNVTDCVNACTVCAMFKVSHQRPQGGLFLSVLKHPWSYISLDFVTGLPPSSGNMVVLAVVDRLCKMACFIPLPKLPSAKETCF